ncbi:hypothetical protein [Chitinophaga tropicalis]|uniref:Cell wall anchor protein n=1 Tax=Chitinophaga tropicalis TaxID=2683588 RepID=A0A7K1U0E0_9BACT|nr:hypothetical protein [Chitinophaga tropicalis]MVT07831.1 hypothetical protein [Chitinophaga tropicalis]
MHKILFSLAAILLPCFSVNAQTQSFTTINFPNTYTNTITTGLYTSNFRSGFIYQTNASINYGLTGPKASLFRFRWLAHDNGTIDYATDADQVMFLDGNGNLNFKGTLATGGNVGIGTAPTSEKVTIDMGATRGSVNMISDGDAAAYTDLKFSVKTTTGLTSGKPTAWLASFRKDGYFSNDLTGPTLEFYALKKDIGGYYAPLLFKSNGDVIIAGARNATNGSVAIGTTDPGEYKLAVKGSIGATKVKVTLTGWADFVFEPAYKLPSLSELDTYIKANKHLPGVPSATEVEKNGIDLGEMNKVLLQKIEELTLHLIDMKKEIGELKQQNKRLEQEIRKEKNDN